MDRTFAERLQLALDETDISVAELARRSRIGDSTIRNWLPGKAGKKPSLPSSLNAADIADALGISLQWLVAGRGAMRSVEAPVPSEPQAERSPVLDGDLMGRIVDVIERVYSDLGVRLPRIDLGRLAAEKYAEIVNDAEDPDEWPSLLDLLGKRLKRSLVAAAVDPANGKREA